MRSQATTDSLTPIANVVEYSANDKLQWEVRKLQAEVENLSKPFWKQPNSWFAFVTLIISVSVSFSTVYYNHAESARRVIDAEKKILELAVRELRQEKHQLEAAANLVKFESLVESKANAAVLAIAEAYREAQKVREDVPAPVSRFANIHSPSALDCRSPKQCITF